MIDIDFNIWNKPSLFMASFMCDEMFLMNLQRTLFQIIKINAS